MIKKLNYKMIDVISNSHSECGAMKLADHFINAHSISGDTTSASLIAVIPCTREIARRIKAKCVIFQRKIISLLGILIS